MLLKPQNTTAFVEFETKQGAQKSVNSSSSPLGPVINGNRVNFEFTGYDEVFFEDSPTTPVDKPKSKESQRYVFEILKFVKDDVIFQFNNYSILRLGKISQCRALLFKFGILIISKFPA